VETVKAMESFQIKVYLVYCVIGYHLLKTEILIIWKNNKTYLNVQDYNLFLQPALTFAVTWQKLFIPGDGGMGLTADGGLTEASITWDIG